VLACAVDQHSLLQSLFYQQLAVRVEIQTHHQSQAAYFAGRELFELALQVCARVDEIDTTEKSPKEVADLVTGIIQGRLELPPGQVNWLDEFFG
jgi:broad-specificity NMP kinase